MNFNSKPDGLTGHWCTYDGHLWIKALINGVKSKMCSECGRHAPNPTTGEGE